MTRLENILRRLVVAMLLCVATTSCFTGVESTPRVTARDVERALSSKHEPQSSLLNLVPDSVPAWQEGKQFYVCDDQARMLMSRSASYDIDTLHLGHRMVTYAGYSTGDLLDNRPSINLRFASGRDTLLYRTGKTMQQFSPSFSIPLFIDMDLVAQAHRQLAGRELYIMSPIWYDRSSEQMLTGRHYVRVRIDSVQPGNKVLPLRVLFTALDGGEHAMVWVATDHTMRDRGIDALFVERDPRADHRDISDATWRLIINGKVAEDMTKQECRLALGSPKRITPIHDQSGLREYWYYDGGAYLFFVDGLLKRYRL